MICIGNAVSCRRPPAFLFVNGIDLLDRDEDGERSLAKTTVDASGRTVVCPPREWRFDIDPGATMNGACNIDV